MPIYEYKCRKCGNTFDHFTQRISESAPNCPKCGSPDLQKQFSAFNTDKGGTNSSSCLTGTCPTDTCSL